ncbi:ArsR/SmtB family transcription factor [Qipengyuania sediminis]|uniref:ArsR/SmtB family transcription factor n=1 Tax=Qipengyuania sediminis TaxID=1532023 RepID=UPI003B831632
MPTETAFRALGDLTRLRIMRLIATMELAVGEIAQVLGQSQPRVSRHIAILTDAGLAERRREGSWMFLRTRGGGEAEGLSAQIARMLTVAETLDPAFGVICEEDRRRLAAIRAIREAQAQDYFAAHAEDWDELRRMHCADEAVEQALVGALAAAPIGRMLDIGTGTGRMAELLAPHAEHIVALDKSPAMLRLARARLQHIGSSRIAMVQGDFIDLPVPAQSVDTVVFHQVLHFAQDPAAVLREAARVTRPGGRIAIVDFAAHGREELRERHAHARLGFEDRQMERLLKQAGFSPADTITPGEGELVVRIWIAVRRQAVRAASRSTRASAAA